MNKFFGIIGNPPYQINDENHQNSAQPVYQDFVEESIKLGADSICMVTPSRWFTGGRGLDDFRDHMLSGHHLIRLVDYPKLYEPFANVKIRGGVSYFVWKRDYDGPCEMQTIEGGKQVGPTVKRYLDDYDVLVRSNRAIPILEKVTAKNEPTIDERFSTARPFKFRASFHGKKSKEGIADPVKLYESQTTGWVNRDEVKLNNDLIDKWKVLVNIIQGTSAAVETKFLSNPILAGPQTACTETYLIAGVFDNKEEAESYISYLKTRFARFLISLRKATQNASRNVYSFVPDVPCDRIWTDEDLYDRYGITREEIEYIESIVKEMQ